MKKAILSAASIFAVFGALAAPVRVKLGTLAPVGTAYHKTLMAMAESWRKDSGGSVDLVVYAGGKLGGEAEMVGLMKANSLQAAMLTAVGLMEIEPAVGGLQNIPMGWWHQQRLYSWHSRHQRFQKRYSRSRKQSGRGFIPHGRHGHSQSQSFCTCWYIWRCDFDTECPIVGKFRFYIRRIPCRIWKCLVGCI